MIGNDDNLKELLEGLFKLMDGSAKDTAIGIAKSETHVHFDKKGHEAQVKLSGHPISILTLMEAGVAQTISDLERSSKLPLNKREMFEMFTKGVKDYLHL